MKLHYVVLFADDLCCAKVSLCRAAKAIILPVYRGLSQMLELNLDGSHSVDLDIHRNFYRPAIGLVEDPDLKPLRADGRSHSQYISRKRLVLRISRFHLARLRI